jgi:hypothetical protein
MTRSRCLTVALALALGSSACNSADTLGPESTDSTDDAIATVLADADPRSDRGGGGSQLFDRLAREIPGFGGLYRNAPCSISVVLTDMSQAEHAVRVVKAAVEALVGRACPNGVRVQAVQGKFTYLQLQRFLAAARELFQIRGVLGAHVDYQLNRLVITVSSREVAAAVLAALPRVGIPAEAVAFRLAPTTTRTPATSNTGSRG